MRPSSSHCIALVRAGDPDRYAASLFLPEAARPHVHALLAFNLEIAKLRETVSQPMLGEIRMQWWRDAITNQAPAGNPVAGALIETITAHALDPAPLLALIEARSFDLYDDPMPSMAAYDNYIRDTSVALFDLIARIVTPGFPAQPAVEAAARATAITGLLRALPYQVMKGQIFLPLDLLDEYGVPLDQVLAHRHTPELGRALAALREKARGELSAMKAALPGCPAPEACLPAFLCESYLRQMEKPGFDPFQTPVELAPWRRLWVLWRAAWRM